MFLVDKLMTLFKGTCTEQSEYVEVESTETDVDLSTLRVVDLRSLAKERGLKGYTKLKKHDLVSLLSDN